MRSQKSIERFAGCEAEQPAQFGLGQMAELIFLQGQRFERAALDLSGGTEPPGQIVGDAESDFHSVT
jgi:hypothetical protein